MCEICQKEDRPGRMCPTCRDFYERRKSDDRCVACGGPNDNSTYCLTCRRKHSPVFRGYD